MKVDRSVAPLWHRSRFAYGDIIHIRQILLELWILTLRIFTHFSLSSQLLLNCRMNWNESKVGRSILHYKNKGCTCGERIHVHQTLQELWLLKYLSYNFVASMK